MPTVKQHFVASGSTVKFDAIGPGASGNVSSLSWSHTATAGALVIVALTTDRPNISAATYGGVQMLPLAIARNPNGPNGTTVTQLHAIRNVAGGTQTIALTLGATSNVVANSVSYLNVGTFGWPQPVNSGPGGATSDTQTIACFPGQTVFSARGAQGSGTPTWNGGTNRYSGSTNGSVWLSISDAPGATTFTASATAANHWNDVALLLRPTGSPDIGVDAIGSYASGGNVTTMSWSHTIAADASAVLVGVTSSIKPTDAPVTVKVGTTSMTQLSSVLYMAGPTFWRRMTVFSLLSPPAGTQTVTVTTSGTVTMTGNSVSYVNVSGFGTPVTNSVNAAAASSTVSLTVPSTAAQPVFAAFTNDTTTSGEGFHNYDISIHTNTTYVTNYGFPLQLVDGNGANGVSFSNTLPPSPATLDWAAIGVPLLP